MTQQQTRWVRWSFAQDGSIPAVMPRWDWGYHATTGHHTNTGTGHQPGTQA